MLIRIVNYCKKIDVSKTAKEIIGEEDYWMPQTVRKEKIIICMKNPSCRSGIFYSKTEYSGKYLGLCLKVAKCKPETLRNCQLNR